MLKKVTIIFLSFLLTTSNTNLASYKDTALDSMVRSNKSLALNALGLTFGTIMPMLCGVAHFAGAGFIDKDPYTIGELSESDSSDKKNLAELIKETATKLNISDKQLETMHFYFPEEENDHSLDWHHRHLYFYPKFNALDEDNKKYKLAQRLNYAINNEQLTRATVGVIIPATTFLTQKVLHHYCSTCVQNNNPSYLTTVLGLIDTLILNNHVSSFLINRLCIGAACSYFQKKNYSNAVDQTENYNLAIKHLEKKSARRDAYTHAFLPNWLARTFQGLRTLSPTKVYGFFDCLTCQERKAHIQQLQDKKYLTISPLKD